MKSSSAAPDRAPMSRFTAAMSASLRSISSVTSAGSVSIDADPAPVDADPVRMTQALGSVIAALRRELVGDEGLTVRTRRTQGGYEIARGDAATLEALEQEPAAARGVFDEWRGGVGLSLAVARRILNAHGAAIYGAPDGRKAGARIVISKP